MFDHDFTTPVKICSKCGEKFPATKQYFYASKKSDDGLRPECKGCHRNPVRIPGYENVPEGYKRCARCGDSKPLGEYFRSSYSYDGLKSACKDCYAMASGRKRHQNPYENVPSGYKRCTKCGDVLPDTSEYFYQRSNGKLRDDCKECKSAYDYVYRMLHADEIRQGQILYRILNEDRIRSRVKTRYWENVALRREKSSQYYYANRKEFLRKCREYRIINIDRVTEYRKEQYRKDPEKAKKAAKEWRQNNPDKSKANKKAAYLRRLARIGAGYSSFTAGDWIRCLEYWDHRCAVCGASEGFWNTIAADHWIAVSMGGENSATNVVPLCHSKKDGGNCCNNLKGNQHPGEWLKSRYGSQKADKIVKRVEDYFEWVRLQK